MTTAEDTFKSQTIKVEIWRVRDYLNIVVNLPVL